VLRWTQADSFEQNVVLSMPKFRERFDQLRGKAARTNVTPISAHQRLQEMRNRVNDDDPEAA
jgi:hypothetical protein